MIWTLIGLVSTLVSWDNVRYSKHYVDAVQKFTNGSKVGRFETMRILAYGHYRNDLFRFCKSLTILFVGVIACLLPIAPGASRNVTPVSIVITGGLFTIALLIMMASILDRRQREVIERSELPHGSRVR